MKTIKWTLSAALLAFGAGPTFAEPGIETAFDFNLALADLPAATTPQEILSAFDYEPPAVQALVVVPQESIESAFNYDPATMMALPATPQQNLQTAFNYNLADEEGDDSDAEEPADSESGDCGCADDASCACEEPACGCEASCGCESGCDSGWFGGCSLCDGCVGDAWTIHDEYMECCDHVIAGWFAVGYHSDLTGLSREYGDLRDFNDVPGRFNLHQAFLTFEKVADGSDCSADWGYRFDAMYGTDAQKMQANGNPNSAWDVGWDHGVYGWALPQAYAQVAYGNLDVIAGHFITPLGYESVLAPQNFFYSHSLQSFNSEPFTHTGVLSKYKTDGGWTLYNGWTLGWDTGYDQFDGGSNYIGGAGYKPSEEFEVVYLTTVGNLGARTDGEFGYSHSIYVVAMLSEDWEYGLASDYVTSDGFFGDPTFHDQDLGIANYLYYTVSEKVALGGRAEWWKSNQVNGEQTSFYEITGGINYWVNGNIVVRPEMRYDWCPAEASLNDFQYNRAIFGIDAVVTF